MFGLKIMTNRKFQSQIASAESIGEQVAISKIIDLLRHADKICMEPIILFGDNQTITNNVCFGNPKGDPCISIQR
jgi:hypothetical protein